MVFVTVSDYKSLNFLFISDKVLEIRNDVVDSKEIIFRKLNSRIDYDDFILKLDPVHVLSNFAQTADCKYSRLIIFYFKLFHRLKLR